MTIFNVVNEPYRWMDFSIRAKVEGITNRTKYLEQGIYAETEKVFQSLESQDLEMFVGRILSEVTETETDGKVLIDSHSLLLECASADKFRNYKLVMGKCEEYVIYVGQTCGVIGRMDPGDILHVERIIPGIPPPNIVAPPVGEVHVTVACGPYSPENALIFDSLGEIEARIKSGKAPDFLVLMGPFLDASHPQVSQGTLVDPFGRAVTFEDIYREEIIPKLGRLGRVCENARTRLVIVPSLSEARIGLPLPQPPINSLKSGVWESLMKELPQSALYLSNPGVLVLPNNQQIYVTSADAVSALNSTMLFKHSSVARLDGCLGQFIWARSLFPVNPCNLRIDETRRDKLDLPLNQVPDIYITPSLGRRFVKSVLGRTFVNPGYMSDPAGTTSWLAEIVIKDGVVQGDVVKL